MVAVDTFSLKLLNTVYVLAATHKVIMEINVKLIRPSGATVSRKAGLMSRIIPGETKNEIGVIAMLNERPYVTIIIGTDCSEWKSMTKDREEELKQEVISAVQEYLSANDYNIGIEVVFACRPSDKITFSDQNDEDKDKIEGDIFEILGDVEHKFLNEKES